MPESVFDSLVAFSIPDRDARGRCVRMGPVLDTILSAHDYPLPIRHLLAEALILTALMGSLLKGEGGQLTMQAQSASGLIDLLVCDYRDGAVRGYVKYDAERLAAHGSNTALRDLFGKDAHLAMTFDLAEKKQRYQGIVPLDGTDLAQACESYFRQSEQVPTIMRVAVRFDGTHCIAGGLLIQHLPQGEEGRERLHVKMDHPDWEHIAVMGGSVRHSELVDPSLTIEQILWRLFHEESEIRIEPMPALMRGCRCTAEHYIDVLSRFPQAERVEMRADDGLVHVDCAFCSKVFRIEV
ncbi:Hsp33 family molecular chaperone HslO [Croceicoccus sp. YJ47]|uniref:Hsp33 family molecular chaperone HslO n=1 Tax=Croceicoccus sp. YJ47 TaxID=2798724 RepID=UPI001921AFB6|nr:Hsp33 family molecular chaperone HslO [Croceicoccus sp. YJ47]QQN75673.1 Hsp33 family molecular chaperone HslO [Croceicoccus sp. YJ47]